MGAFFLAGARASAGARWGAIPLPLPLARGGVRVVAGGAPARAAFARKQRPFLVPHLILVDYEPHRIMGNVAHTHILPSIVLLRAKGAPCAVFGIGLDKPDAFHARAATHCQQGQAATGAALLVPVALVAVKTFERESAKESKYG